MMVVVVDVYNTMIDVNPAPSFIELSKAYDACLELMDEVDSDEG
jgi:hypothetical protein